MARQTNSPLLKAKTFSVWAREWLTVYKKPSVDDNTYRLTYQNIVENHLIPYFQEAALTDIMPVDIAKFFALKSNDYSESTLSKMKLCLNGIFEAAIDNDLCYKNPTKHIKAQSKKEKTPKRVYSTNEIEIVEKLAAKLLPEAAILLETGFRRGELLGLMWSDIDFENNTIKVERSIADQKGGGVKINPPKKGSRRVIPLTPIAKQILEQLPHSGIYVFPNVKNCPQSPNSWGQKLERFMEQLPAGIPKLTAHELRHTRGTELRRQGVDIYTIQKIMGHKDIKMTSEIYVHNEIEELKRAIFEPRNKAE